VNLLRLMKALQKRAKIRGTEERRRYNQER
jgi:hypothetical protein